MATATQAPRATERNFTATEVAHNQRIAGLIRLDHVERDGDYNLPGIRIKWDVCPPACDTPANGEAFIVTIDEPDGVDARIGASDESSLCHAVLAEIVLYRSYLKEVDQLLEAEAKRISECGEFYETRK